VTDEAVDGVLQDHTDDVAEVAVADRFDALVSVISDLASRVDATQRRLDAMHLVLISRTQSADVVPSSGAIPKRPAGGNGQGCVLHLQDLHTDARAVHQANRMVDALESSIQGNNSVRALRRRWSIFIWLHPLYDGGRIFVMVDTTRIAEERRLALIARSSDGGHPLEAGLSTVPGAHTY
jgi:hypothetical protein